MKKKQVRDKLKIALLTSKMSKLKTTIILCLAGVTAFILSGCAITSNKVNPYSFDTAKIEYSLEGNLSGKQIVFIKGDMASHQTTAVKTIDETQEDLNTLYVEAGPDRYEIDLLAKTGTKSPNPIYSEMSTMDHGQKIEFLTKIATFMDENEQVPTSTGEKVIAGQTCKTYEIKDRGEVCLWDGILLYSKLSLANGKINNTMTATSVQTGIVVEDNVFAIPLDVTISEAVAA